MQATNDVVCRFVVVVAVRVCGGYPGGYGYGILWVCVCVCVVKKSAEKIKTKVKPTFSFQLLLFQV